MEEKETQGTETQTEKSNLLAKLPAKTWALIGAAVAAAVVIALLAGGRIKAATMHLLRTEGTVSVADGEGREVAPKENLGLYGGYQVGTRSSSYAWIDLDEVKLAKMDQDSEIQIHKEDKHLEVEVKSGSLFFNITRPLAEDEALEIRTSTMMVGVRGTCGWVVSDGEKGAQVFILEGRVEVGAAGAGSSMAVDAGEMAQLAINEDGKPEITVRPFAEEYVPDFVRVELEEDSGLSAAVLEASGLDVVNPPDPAERLKAEYEEIIAGRPLFDYANEGLCYADYIDFENDGVPELFMIQFAPADQNGDWVYSMELYGEELGYAKQYDTADMMGPYLSSMADWDGRGIWLSRSEGRIYIHMCDNSGQNGSNWYYTVEDGSFVESDHLDAVHGSAYETGLYSFDQEITAEEFKAIADKYVDETKIVGEGPRPMLDRGILPELPSESLRRLAFLDALESGNAKYAKLIDMDQDGEEELILLESKKYVFEDTGYTYEDYVDVFSVYSWNGAGIESVTMDEGGITIAGGDSGPSGVYRDQQTGDIYVGYEGGWERGEDSTFHSLTDSVDFSLDYVGGDWLEGEEMAAAIAENERLRAEYQAKLKRFEPIDKFEFGAGYPDTVDQVRQQLMAR